MKSNWRLGYRIQTLSGQIEKDIFDYTGGLALSLLPLSLVVSAGYLKLSGHSSLLLNWLECRKLSSGYGEQIAKG